MTAKQHSKARRNPSRTAPATKPAAPQAQTTPQPPTDAQLIEIGRRLWDFQHQPKQPEPFELWWADRKANGLTLDWERLNWAETLLSAINSTADSINQLAVTAVCSSSQNVRDALLVGIENSAKVVGLKCDALYKLLGTNPKFGNFNRHAFGNFDAEFDPNPPEQPAA